MKVTSEAKNKENEVYIMTTNSSVESAKAEENERTRNDFCYFLDKKFSDYGKLELLSQRIKEKIQVYAQIMPKRLATEMVVSMLL